MKGKEILVNGFGILEDELHSIKSVGSMLGNTKSLTVTFSTVSKGDSKKGGSNRKSLPVGNMSDSEILAIQLEISMYINSRANDLLAILNNNQGKLSAHRGENNPYADTAAVDDIGPQL